MGMHGSQFDGSALPQALRQMDSDQHLLEIVPDMGPGSMCFFARMMGVPYYFNKCDDCWTGKMDKFGNKEMGKWNGNAHAAGIVHQIGNILNH